VEFDMTTTMTTTVFACPVCAEMLPAGPGGYACVNGHQFDIAREGYVNLLLAQHRRSKDPGYNKEMIAGRREFFDAGHYQRLADEVAKHIRAALPPGRDPMVLDAGCGEGYYLRRFRALLAGDASHGDALLCGLDISKYGIKVAAKRDPQGIYAVAGTHRMPVLAERVDVLLSHFSPISTAEFRRVVKPGGVVLVGGPGEGHLFSFKQLLYERPARHEPVAALAQERGFELIDTSTIQYPLSLRGPGQVANLLLMTPFFWSVDERARARLAALDRLDTEVDVVVQAYRRTRQVPAGLQ
jgi:23S rRNA (guanine745-N1)-methyltransferase